MRSVLAAVAQDRISVVFSTHVVAELEKVTDYLVVLGRGQILLTGEVASLTAEHGTSLERIVLACMRGHSLEAAA
jgi:ABC-2 type transport system ATP-binding protein